MKTLFYINKMYHNSIEATAVRKNGLESVYYAASAAPMYKPYTYSTHTYI